ncbi:MAG: dihydrofolate reductase [Mycoplasmoidaceae bacterium]|nr:dihydrofolate reductase [Mycoplasmoidaceae bacterium]
MNLTAHKTVIYPVETFLVFNKVPLPNRVNIVYSYYNKKVKDINNVVVNNNYKDIVSSFGGKNEDLYIIGSTRDIIERFAKDVDFIIDYSTEEMGYTTASIFDSINFADFTLLKKQELEHYDIRYFVREKTNFIGY